MLGKRNARDSVVACDAHLGTHKRYGKSKTFLNNSKYKMWDHMSLHCVSPNGECTLPMSTRLRHRHTRASIATHDDKFNSVQLNSQNSVCVCVCDQRGKQHMLHRIHVDVLRFNEHLNFEYNNNNNRVRHQRNKIDGGLSKIG